VSAGFLVFLDNFFFFLVAFWRRSFFRFWFSCSHFLLSVCPPFHAFLSCCPGCGRYERHVYCYDSVMLLFIDFLLRLFLL